MSEVCRTARIFEQDMVGTRLAADQSSADSFRAVSFATIQNVSFHQAALTDGSSVVLAIAATRIDGQGHQAADKTNRQPADPTECAQMRSSVLAGLSAVRLGGEFVAVMKTSDTRPHY